MIDFYVIKDYRQEAFYNNLEDIGYIDLNEARKQIDNFIKANNNGEDASNFYILRIQIEPTQEVINCLLQSVKGNKITKYSVVETINIEPVNI